MSKVCRCLPSLEDERLAWSESQVATLQQVLSQKSGFTILQGPENATGFLLTALGHSCCRLSRKPRAVLGLDIRRPDRFVPVPGLVYLDQPSSPERLRQLAQKSWAAVRQARGRLLLLNGIWHALPELRVEIQRFSKVCHVVVADHALTIVPGVIQAEGEGPKLVIAVKENTNKRIQIECQQP